MAELEIITEGDPRLRQKASRVRKVDDDVRKLAQSMMETVESTPYAIALAAPQVGVLRRVIVVKLPAEDPEEAEEGEEPEGPVELMLANPEIIRSSGQQTGIEGCLSIPGWIGEVKRAMHVTVKARDMSDKEVRVKASGFLSRALQHEIDHLDGILFVDHVEDRETLRYEPFDDEDDEDAASPDTIGQTEESRSS
ncbi:MAG: peptide deformylase [Sphaerobacteraceae bacterium]|nr:MAG: peptide deformylase [Sphaerobacteraceae bacterium]